MPRLRLRQPGEFCEGNDSNRHLLLPPEEDRELQAVLDWLACRPTSDLYTKAIESSLNYVLDGARTGRFDLLSPEVHPGERASVGAKLEYEVLHVFRLPKEKPLDTLISGIPVDIKATVGANWAIPSEAHCQLCLCTQIQVSKNQHKTWLTRAHRSWLYRGKGNKDGKRGIAIQARDSWSVPLYDWTPLPVNPLKLLSPEETDVILASKTGLEKRMAALFHALPNKIIPRHVILTVGSGRQDPMRRARAVKNICLRDNLLVLCGKWQEDRERAAALGISLAGEPTAEWIALPLPSVPDSIVNKRMGPGILAPE